MRRCILKRNIYLCCFSLALVIGALAGVKSGIACCNHPGGGEEGSEWCYEAGPSQDCGWFETCTIITCGALWMGEYHAYCNDLAGWGWICSGSEISSSSIMECNYFGCTFATTCGDACPCYIPEPC